MHAQMLPRRTLFITTTTLLAVQIALIVYSFTYNARKVAFVDGSEFPTLRLGVYEAHWVFFRIVGPLGADAGPAAQFDHVGFRYVGTQNQSAFVTVHFAWTVAINLAIIYLAGRSNFRLRPPVQASPVAG